MVIECDYTSYYHHPPPVRVYGMSQSKFPLSSPWKREVFSHLESVYFQEGWRRLQHQRVKQKERPANIH